MIRTRSRRPALVAGLALAAPKSRIVPRDAAGAALFYLLGVDGVLADHPETAVAVRTRLFDEEDR